MLAGSMFANQVRLDRARHINIEYQQSLPIGDFTVTAFPVDHSIFGCVGYLVESGGKSIFYTGDLRLHGRKPGMMRDLVKQLQSICLDALVMEGTHFGFPDGDTMNEYQLEDEFVQVVREADGLVLASFSP